MRSGFARFVFGGAALLTAALAHAAATLDSSFGDGGSTAVPFSILSILSPADGSLLLTGQASTYGLVQASSITAAKLLANGKPDPTFAFAGYPLSAGQPQGSSGGWGALQADGKFVLIGQRNESGGYFTRGARFEASGKLDAGFASLALAGIPGIFGGAVIQSNGAVVMAVGSSLVRVRANGSIDDSFGAGGVAPLPINPFPSEIVKRIHTLPDDRLVVLTFANVCTPSIPPFCGPSQLMRFTADGQLDATLNGTGRIVFNGVYSGDLAMLGDGRMLLSWNESTFRQSAHLQRLMPDGSADTSFGQSGIVYLQHPEYQPVAIEAEPDGSITALAHSLPLLGVARSTFALLRWKGDGTPDGLVVPMPPAGYAPSVLVIPADGKRLVAGLYETTAANTTTYNSYVMRFGAGTMDIVADPQLFVAQQYRDFLQREGDAGGIEAWSRLLDSGSLSRAAVASAFLESAEYQGGALKAVARLYLALLLRVPDYEGLQFWSEYARTHSLQEIAGLMAQSPEFQARYPMGNAEFVDQVYLNVMGRAADAPGHQFWTAQLDGGTMTRGDVVLAFSGSEELRRGSESEVFVASVYSAFLQRAPDAAGFAHWLGHLDSGGSRQDLIQAFIDSAEYRFRFMP
jgi:uncharacterized delta-60 repeat protein